MSQQFALFMAVTKLAKTLANCIIKADTVKEMVVDEIPLDDSQIYIPIQSIHLDGTKFALQKLLNQDVSKGLCSVLKAAQAYFKAALNYVLEKFLITNDTLLHAKWIDVGKCTNVKWESVEHFIYKFTLFSDIVDDLYDEFCDYKTDEDIGRDAWNEAKVVDGYVDGTEVIHYRVEISWWNIGHMVIPESSARRSCCLLKVAELILVLPYSNAGEERLFSMVHKNKTDSGSSLKFDGTLSNLQ